MISINEKVENIKKRKKINRDKWFFYWVMFAFPIVQTLIFYLFVNIKSFVMAFQELTPDGYGNFPYFGNFKAVFRDLFTERYLIASIGNSLELFGLSVIIGSLGAVAFSYYLYRRYPLSGMFKTLLYMPNILSMTIMAVLYSYFADVAIPQYLLDIFGVKIKGLMDNYETEKTAILIFCLFFSFGSSVLLYSGTMSGISESIIESGRLDGITPFKELVFIVVPMIWPTFTTFMVSSVVGIFTNQMHLFTFYGTGAEYRLYTFGYFLYKEVFIASPAQYPYLSAMGFALTIVAIPLTLLVRWALEKFGPSVE